MIGVGFEVKSEPSDCRFPKALVKTSARVLIGNSCPGAAAALTTSAASASTAVSCTARV